MRLSKNFTLGELTRSQRALRLGMDNTPPDFAIENLQRLVTHVLQPVRDHFGAVAVSSGYRSAGVNAAEGGALNSQHLLGEAVDFEVPGVPNMDVCEWIRDNLQFDQLIAEYLKKDDPAAGWIHVSYSQNLRKQVLSCIARRKYVPGLVYA